MHATCRIRVTADAMQIRTRGTCVW